MGCLNGKVTSKPILVYPNSGERYDADRKEWVENTEVGGEDFGVVRREMDGCRSLIAAAQHQPPSEPFTTVLSPGSLFSSS
ncbi:unnamed protein product [Eruca vesicaria subsp. sativa]|uniref:Uncharacterized protein n=1 Tax=Eruca vesicaria subsp. sativa TaxID=29727 RepID=A0ABC8K7M6_ERUVS|nr:unnamed protein product [Eruca vesicaria subsp. sativa]